MLCHCTLIVWSGSLTRSVATELISPNVNETDKFVTLVDSKAKTIKVSQLSEARLLGPSLLKKANGKFYGKLVEAAPAAEDYFKKVADFMHKNPISPGPFIYFMRRLSSYIQIPLPPFTPILIGFR
uniref:Uncharacterized protein n=2 Tax=Tetranychus urticae TaxID=32264 RepID=T1KH40_TETUR